jgi:hypothetical protein
VDTTGLKGSAETFIRMWERAAGTRSGMADAASDIDTSGVATYVSRETREQAYPTQCGERYAPAYQVLGGSCRFNAECQSNKCTSAPCTIQTGTCICDDDADCGTNKYCGYALNAGICQNKKASGALCAYGFECLSGTCRLTITGTRCK